MPVMRASHEGVDRRFTGDIADPYHPFRFHQVVSSLRRSVELVDPAQTSTQPQPSSTAERASSHQHTTHGASTSSSTGDARASSHEHIAPESSTLSSAKNPQSSSTDNAGVEPGTSPADMHLTQSPPDPLAATAAHWRSSTADTWHSKADELEGRSRQSVETGDSGQIVSKSGGNGSGRAASADDAVLQQSTISRGGPVPGAQVRRLTH